MNEHDTKAALADAGWDRSGVTDHIELTDRRITSAWASRPVPNRQDGRERRAFTDYSPDRARALLVASVQQTARSEKLEAAAAQALELIQAYRAYGHEWPTTLEFPNEAAADAVLALLTADAPEPRPRCAETWDVQRRDGAGDLLIDGYGGTYFAIFLYDWLEEVGAKPGDTLTLVPRADTPEPCPRCAELQARVVEAARKAYAEVESIAGNGDLPGYAQRAAYYAGERLDEALALLTTSAPTPCPRCAEYRQELAKLQAQVDQRTHTAAMLRGDAGEEVAGCPGK